MFNARQTVAALIAAAGLVTSVSAQENKTRDASQPETRRQETTKTTITNDERTKHEGSVLVPSTRAEGVTVMNQDGARLGYVKDGIVRGSSGRLVYVLVTQGTEPAFTPADAPTWASRPGRVVAVPFAALSWDDEKRVLTLPMSEEKFKTAPAFESSDWRTLGEVHRTTMAYNFFEVPEERMVQDRKEYRIKRTRDGVSTEEKTVKEEKIKKEDKKDDRKVEPVRKDDSEAINTRDASLIRVSEVRGRPVLNKDAKEFGLVNDVIFDAPSGRVAFLVVTPAAGMNAGDGRIAVPWPSFEVDQTGRLVASQIDAETLRASPRLTQDDWAELRNQGYTEDIYNRYGYDTSVWKETHHKKTTSMKTENSMKTEKDSAWRERYRAAMAKGTSRTVKGKVESVDESGNVTLVNVRTDEGETVTVHMAPKAYMHENNLKVQKGDSVTISGKMIDMDGKRGLCATEFVAADGKRIVVHQDAN